MFRQPHKDSALFQFYYFDYIPNVQSCLATHALYCSCDILPDTWKNSHSYMY